MNDAAEQFALRRHAEAARVGNYVVEADKNFTVQRRLRLARVIEGDDVG